jgi:hypothetical protein
MHPNIEFSTVKIEAQIPKPVESKQYPKIPKPYLDPDNRQKEFNTRLQKIYGRIFSYDVNEQQLIFGLKEDLISFERLPLTETNFRNLIKKVEIAIAHSEYRLKNTQYRPSHELTSKQKENYNTDLVELKLLTILKKFLDFELDKLLNQENSNSGLVNRMDEQLSILRSSVAINAPDIGIKKNQ